jgi:hypothetical protein
VADSYEHKELQGSIKGEEFLDQLIEYQRLRKTVPRSKLINRRLKCAELLNKMYI